MEYKIQRRSTGVLTTNGSGAATGTIEGVNGEILSVLVNLGTSTSLTCTVANDAGTNVINAIAGITSDTVYYVRSGAVNNAGSAITNSHVPYINAGGDMTVTIASGGDTKTVTVDVFYRPY